MPNRLSVLLTPSSEKLSTSRTNDYPYSPDHIQFPPHSEIFRSTPDSQSWQPPSPPIRKPATETNSPRRMSGLALNPPDNLHSQPSLQQLKMSVAEEMALPQLAPPQPVYAGSHSRPPSLDRSRPTTPNTSSRPTTPNSDRARRSRAPSMTPSLEANGETKRRSSWFMKNKDVPLSEPEAKAPLAWIAGHPQQLPYDVGLLWSGRLLPELSNDEEANCYIHLWPSESQKGPSFRVNSAVFAASSALTKLAFGDLYSSAQSSISQVSRSDKGKGPLEVQTDRLSLGETQSSSSQAQGASVSSTSSTRSGPRVFNLSDRPVESRVHLPLNLSPQGLSMPSLPRHLDQVLMDDLQTLVDIRNVFAFLCGQSLVATPHKRTFFHIFMTIASILKSYEFSNVDGSTFGEVASESFDSYVTELGLADVRSSREKTIEGVVLGERMRSVLLYNEAFTHAAGRYEELVAMNSPKWQLISPITENRLTRAAMDLEKRLTSVRLILTDFNFPALFNGIMNSKTSEERKEGVKFEGWKDSFFSMRKYVMGLYQSKYGNWPPKASSKKNNLETSGLNRKVLQDMYRDMSGMYDLLVDRTKLTTRTVDGNDLTTDRDWPIIRALRAALSEYDRSSPPVKPPIPFDLPKFPLIKSTRPGFGSDPKVAAKAINKKLKDDEIARILRASRNDDATVTPFVESFCDFEKHAAHNSNINQLSDQRIGHWIFMYVVLQALPMLACDAPGLRHTAGVEYFLCEPPRSGVPWAHASAGSRVSSMGGERRWFSVGESGGVVNLPSDIVEHGVEGIYRRSHCWVMAEKWSASNPTLQSALHRQESINAMQSARINERLAPPSSTTTTPTLSSQDQFLHPDARSRNPSPHRVAKRRSYIGLGLEALPLPAGVSPGSRSSSAGDRASWAPGSSPYGSRSVTPVHAVDRTKTFDSILGASDQVNKKGKKK